MVDSTLSAPNYDLVLLLFGVLFLAAGWLERELSKYPFSPPIVYVGLGMLIFSLFDLPTPNPLAHGVLNVTGRNVNIQRGIEHLKDAERVNP